MSYIAIKPCNFDKFYAVGERIPKEVIEPMREACLVSEMEIISRLEEAEMQADVNNATIKYSVSELTKMKRDKLIKIAKDYSIDVKNITNKQIIEEIILNQNMSVD